MRSISPPQHSESECLDTCISGIDSEELKKDLRQISNDIVNSGKLYKILGMRNLLHTIRQPKAKDEDLVLGNITKQQLVSLYSSYMVPKAKPARSIYDSIMAGAPLFKCPFCGIVRASTLDHFLPKKKYPLLSVTPNNLIPSCKDCNTGKSSAVATSAEKQTLHPYFDREPFTNEQWLFAEIIFEDPMVVRYFSDPPKTWSKEEISRVSTHLKEFNLSQRYAEEAATELACRSYKFNEYIKDKSFKILFDTLSDEITTHKRLYKNSWQTALYQALLVFYKNKYDKQPKTVQDSGIEKCPRCLGKAKLLGSNCDACNGVGFATFHHFQKLGSEVLFSPVTCDCPSGALNCKICNGNGNVPLEIARNL